MRGSVGIVKLSAHAHSGVMGLVAQPGAGASGGGAVGAMVMISSSGSQSSGHRDHEKAELELGSLTLSLPSCSLTDNLLGDNGLRCLLECLPQLPISGWLK